MNTIPEGMFDEWREWFRSKGPVWQELFASALGKVIAVGIMQGTMKVADQGTHWSVHLPKEWVEQQLKRRFP